MNSQVQIGLQLQNVDDTLSAGQDSIIINRVRMLIGRSFFLRDSDTLFFNMQSRPIDFNLNITDNNTISLGAGPIPEGTYQGINLTIPRADRSNTLIGPDFFEGDRRFTLIAEGIFNDSSFTFRSERVFEPSFEFNPDIAISEFNQVLTFIVTNDVRGWFRSGNTLLDPRVSGNSTEINNNIRDQFLIDIPEQ